MTTNLMQHVHDAEIVAVEADKARKILVIGLRFLDGTRKNIVLNSCSRYRVVDFIHQNVISRVVIHSGRLLSENEVTDRLRWMSSLSDSSSYLSDKDRSELVAKLKNGEGQLLDFVPSYGAEIVALCTSYEEART